VVTLLGLPLIARQVIILIQSLPTAASLAIFAEKFGGNTKTEASELVVFNTLLSALTLPLVMWLLLR
jgi:predicted permease